VETRAKTKCSDIDSEGGDERDDDKKIKTKMGAKIKRKARSEKATIMKRRAR
jgi:hypothetical protein